MFSIIIADDHTIVREGIAVLLNASNDFKVIAQAENGVKLLELLKEKNCDLVLCDISMPEMNGLTVLKRIKLTSPDTKVVLLSMHANRELLDEAIKTGADGYVLKDDSSDTILSLLQGVVKGHKCFSPRIQTILAQNFCQDRSPATLLTHREFQVFKLTAKAHSNREIAENLAISISTVEFHKKNIKDKLNAKNTADLLNIAHQYDII